MKKVLKPTNTLLRFMKMNFLFLSVMAYSLSTIASSSIAYASTGSYSSSNTFSSKDSYESYDRQVSSMLILDDIQPQNSALRNLRDTLNFKSTQMENIKTLEAFDALEVAQRRLEFLYSNGYIKGPDISPSEVNISSKPKK